MTTSFLTTFLNETCLFFVDLENDSDVFFFSRLVLLLLVVLVVSVVVSMLKHCSAVPRTNCVESGNILVVSFAFYTPNWSPIPPQLVDSAI